MSKAAPLIHATAMVEENCVVGEGTAIWHYSHVRSGAAIGKRCNIGRCVYIDVGVEVGDFVKIQNNALLYSGVKLAKGVFVGPATCFLHDPYPRAVHTETLTPVGHGEWTPLPIIVEEGASIGGNCTVLGGVRIGAWAMIGAGSVVTEDIPAYAIAYGNPARVQGRVDSEKSIFDREEARVGDSIPVHLHSAR